MAYRAWRGERSFIVCDGKESAELPEVAWLGFSPDGKHLAVAAGGEKGKVILCDGLQSPEHEQLLVLQRYGDAVGRLFYVVIDKEEASLVEIHWPADRTWEDAFKAEKK